MNRTGIRKVKIDLEATKILTGVEFPIKEVEEAVYFPLEYLAPSEEDFDRSVKIILRSHNKTKTIALTLLLLSGEVYAPNGTKNFKNSYLLKGLPTQFWGDGERNPEEYFFFCTERGMETLPKGVSAKDIFMLPTLLDGEADVFFESVAIRKGEECGNMNLGRAQVLSDGGEISSVYIDYGDVPNLGIGVASESSFYFSLHSTNKIVVIREAIK